MGVRFLCPAGHKLHVKAELAGKRGICPECGAKFIVPSFSGGRVAEDNGDGSSPAAALAAVGTTQPPIAATSAPVLSASAPSVQDAANESVPATHATPAAPQSIAWYVRPASGGQFGPATAEVFQQWIADGRVAIDSWVWRTGWANWKAGGEALALVDAGPASAPAQALAGSIEERAGALPGTVARPEPSKPRVELGTAELRRQEIKRRKQRVRTVSTALALVALAMLMALVVVLVR